MEEACRGEPVPRQRDGPPGAARPETKSEVKVARVCPVNPFILQTRDLRPGEVNSFVHKLKANSLADELPSPHPYSPPTPATPPHTHTDTHTQTCPVAGAVSLFIAVSLGSLFLLFSHSSPLPRVPLLPRLPVRVPGGYRTRPPDLQPLQPQTPFSPTP